MILTTDEQWLIERYRFFNGNLIDLIAKQRGWSALEVYEEMTVTFNTRRYVIVRLEDTETDE